ncbi:hypothetical protein T492DRAFT_885183 [Pavlovales sp. CCMP2436]|nr:hypothetical protein T492DRAFT_885183 [Pavlovales sp. CCMP2436]
MRYAYEHGRPWDVLTTSVAAGLGHLEVLRYAHDPRPRLQRFVFGFLIIHHFYQLPIAA